MVNLQCQLPSRDRIRLPTVILWSVREPCRWSWRTSRSWFSLSRRSRTTLGSSRSSVSWRPLKKAFWPSVGRGVWRVVIGPRLENNWTQTRMNKNRVRGLWVLLPCVGAFSLAAIYETFWNFLSKNEELVS